MKAEYVFGLYVVESLLRDQPASVLEIWLQKSRLDEYAASITTVARQLGIAVQTTDRARLDRLVDNAVHQGVVARIRPMPIAGEEQLQALIGHLGQDAFLLFLDGVQDPHNLGACIRTAEAAGVQAVVFPRDRAASLTAVARKTAAGAAERTALFQVGNLARSLESARKAGIWVVGTAGDSDNSIYEVNLSGPLAVVMGAEGTGLRSRIRGLCDHLVSIPMQGKAESLNVSVATGVALFEASRQRRPN